MGEAAPREVPAGGCQFPGTQDQGQGSGERSESAAGEVAVAAWLANFRRSNQRKVTAMRSETGVRLSPPTVRRPVKMEEDWETTGSPPARSHHGAGPDGQGGASCECVGAGTTVSRVGAPICLGRRNR